MLHLAKTMRSTYIKMLEKKKNKKKNINIFKYLKTNNNF